MQNKKVLRGFRYASPKEYLSIDIWACPGGRREEDETTEAALRREVKEEAGITDLDIRDYIGEVPGWKKGDRLLMFYCTSKQEPELLEPEKFGEWKWFAKEELPEKGARVISPNADIRDGALDMYITYLEKRNLI